MAGIQYPHKFTTLCWGDGRTPKHRQIKLDLNASVKPKVQAHRQFPFAKREQLDEIMNELEEEGYYWRNNRANRINIESGADSEEWLEDSHEYRHDHRQSWHEENKTCHSHHRGAQRAQMNRAKVFIKLDMRHSYTVHQKNPFARKIDAKTGTKKHNDLNIPGNIFI